MQSYINPQVYNIQNPKGLDYAISKIQVKLSALPFLHTIFGRAYIQQGDMPADKQKPGQKPAKRYFPETWGKNYEPANLMPNNNIPSYIFFVKRDPATQANEIKIIPNQIVIRQAVSIIFWCDLKKLDPTKPYDYSEELKRLLLYAVTREASFEFNQMYESFNKVYENFTVLGLSYENYLKPPYYALRIDGFINYDVLPQCGELDDTPSNIPIPPQYPTIEDYLPYRIDLRVGIDTNTGAVIYPNAGTLNPDNYPNNKPNLTLKDIKILSALDMGQGGSFQLIPFTNDGLGWNFADTAGVILDGIITFTARKKLI